MYFKISLVIIGWNVTELSIGEGSNCTSLHIVKTKDDTGLPYTVRYGSIMSTDKYLNLYFIVTVLANRSCTLPKKRKLGINMVMVTYSKNDWVVTDDQANQCTTVAQ